MNAPTIIEQPSADVAEGLKLKAWRKNVMRMQARELAEAIGYGTNQIHCYERGHSIAGKRISPRAWLRFKMACAGFHAQTFCAKTGEGEPLFITPTPWEFNWI